MEDQFNVIKRQRIEDSKYLQIMINLAPEIEEKAYNLINEHGLNKALRISNDKTIQK